MTSAQNSPETSLELPTHSVREELVCKLEWFANISTY